MDRSADIAIVGAGIAGLAHAYFALKKGYKVVLFDRDERAVGASIRNFGMLWPIGQEPGVGLNAALRSRTHWKNIADQAGIWHSENGSLHLAYHEDELNVLQEFVSLYADAPYDCRLVSPADISKLSPAVNQQNLKGGLFSLTEGTIYSREAIKRIPLWLQEKFGLILRFGHVVNDIALPRVVTSRESWRVENAIVCSGADFETLYPYVFDQQSITKCKLQMLKAVPVKPFNLGPSLCAGLTLRHYSAFAKCPSLKKVGDRYDKELKDYKDHGVHVLLAQNNYGELIIGDSHHYGKTFEPFDYEYVNDIILNYLKTFLDAGELRITERWNGIYPKSPGNINLILKPERGVTIVNGFGGAGMTLSFGVAEDVINGL
jgi:FAD dependent oxidoreductase TIGR03364